ncbi:MAG TPA: zinc ABC transporter substrate-binding protein [Acidobacteriota bacterium]|nr:zinc ABC transporter substrate-binding protein [Acidobacteriota bacterium]
MKRIRIAMMMITAAAAAMSAGCRTLGVEEEEPEAVINVINIVASDTLVSGMVASLLPPSKARVSAILPSAQCPGHYDIKLSDIEKVKTADLIVSMKGLPFMAKAEIDENRLLLLDSRNRSAMVPDTYVDVLNMLAAELSARFPEDGPEIEQRREEAVEAVFSEALKLQKRLVRAGVVAMPVLTASMQKETVEWMGFRVVGEYGRPETLTAKEVARLSKIARDMNIALVADNLQSGPDAGRGIAEALGVPHTALSNFPLEDGYISALRANVDLVLDAVGAL